MRICFFSMSTSRGGAERVLTTLCNRWPYNDELALLSCFDAKDGYPTQVRQISLMTAEEYFSRGRVKAFLVLSRVYRKAIAEIQPDVIVCFLPLPCAIAYVNRRKLGLPIIGAERANPYIAYHNDFLKNIFDYIYSGMDGFVFQTHMAAEAFSRKCRGKAVIIGNPLDEKAFSPHIGERQPNRNEIVSVGRFAFEKNYPLLIEAFAAVHERFPATYLRIYGKEDPILGIRKQISALGLDNNVFLMGQTDDVAGAIHNAGIFVLSSRSEGMPNALMEAMALGLPCVATDCPSGGPRELISDHVNGLLVPNENAKALADAICGMLKEPERAEEMGRKAAEVRNRYKTEEICREWKEYLLKICKP